MTDKKFATGIAYTDFNYKGYRVSVTVRDGDRLQAEGTLLALLDVIDEVIEPSLKQQTAVKQEQDFNGSFEDPDLSDVEPIEQDSSNKVEREDFPLGKDWGLVDYPPKASEIGFHDIYEVPATEYVRGAGHVEFYNDKSKYPVVKHNLKADYPREQFEKIFNGWNPDITEGRKPIPNGEVILQVQCTDESSQTDHGNPYQNLVGQYRRK